MYYSLKKSLSNSNFLDLISNIPKTTKELSLEKNSLFGTNGRWTEENLIQLFSAIPPNVEKLILRENVEGLIVRHRLDIILKHIPKTVTCLDLGSNPIGHMMQNEIINIFSKIPSNICQLILDNTSLNYNCISCKKNQAEIFQAIPSHVDQITLSLDELPSDNQQLLAMANALPYVENLILEETYASLVQRSEVSSLKENSGKYPRFVEAYKQLIALPMPKPIVHEIVAQFLEEDEAAVLRILEASFFNHSTVNSATDVIPSAARDLQAPSG